jgi:hypothetical protein
MWHTCRRIALCGPLAATQTHALPAGAIEPVVFDRFHGSIQPVTLPATHWVSLNLWGYLIGAAAISAHHDQWGKTLRNIARGLPL